MLIGMTGQPKSRGVAALVDRLQSDLGDGYFTEVPYWDGDETAIGLASPADLRVLVYLSIMPGDAAVFLQCERPAGRDDDPDVPYEVASSGSYTDYGQVLNIVRHHLAH
jgi:hypothetical protein